MGAIHAFIKNYQNKCNESLEVLEKYNFKMPEVVSKFQDESKLKDHRRPAGLDGNKIHTEI